MSPRASAAAPAAALVAVMACAAAVSSMAGGTCPDSLSFLKSKCSQWQSQVLPQKIPAARGNEFADRDDAAALGMKIFYDNRFSKTGSGVACVNCHDPEHAFAEKKPRSNTIKEVARNAPDLINAAWYTRSHFWDGKVDNLWSAPLFTFEQEDEMGSSRLQVVHTLAAIYKIRYEKIFGPIPDFSDLQRFPAAGKPGSPEFDAMSELDKRLVDRVYANIGKALEAYIRKLAAGRAPFDDFINGYPQALSPAAQRGMVAFTRNGCDSCHSGPTFTDEGFHDLHLPAVAGLPQDAARAGGMLFAARWQFTSDGEFAEPRSTAPLPGSRAANERSGFRTPTLRNLARTYPYGHDGTLATLDQAIDAHVRVLPKHATLAPQDKQDIVEFLRALVGRPPQPPWNYWPGG